MATVNRLREDEVKKLVHRWSSGEFETEPLLEEVEGRWQTAEEQRTAIAHRRLLSGVDYGPETVFESAEREIMNTPYADNNRKSEAGATRSRLNFDRGVEDRITTRVTSDSSREG
ncbi:hypothetical protein Q9L58_007481 [Maublancomyces gigas]|uniref:Uncharacterized protein n=1 Tax=Discina gigas TaxID=1032678 RepID=A0ABR3GC94_9PEZI